MVGYYSRQYSPKGLFIQDNKLISAPDYKNIPDGGNFYLEPNGIFAIKTNGQLIVASRDKFRNEYDGMFFRFSGIKYALQSGPMLVVDGKINSQFSKNSKSHKPRTGVGIDKQGKAVFVLSLQNISFYNFAEVFRKLGCDNALFLDGGVIATMYADDEGVLSNTRKPLVAMIGVLKQETKH